MLIIDDVQYLTYQEYDAIHRFLRKKYGRATKCDYKKCTKTPPYYCWCLKTNRFYSLNKSDYRQMCPQCHSNFDSKNGKYSANKKVKVVHFINPVINALIRKHTQKIDVNFKLNKDKKICTQ